MSNDSTAIVPHGEMLTNMLGRTRAVAEWMQEHEVSEVCQRFGDWVVTDFGLECLTNYYPITASRLWDGEDGYPWSLHLEQKTWVNIADFTAALQCAREYHKANEAEWFGILMRGDSRCPLT